MVTEKRKEKVNNSFSENALKIMKKRYLSVDEKGNQETPSDMFVRVAKALASVEKDYGKDATFIKKTAKEFFNIMADKEFTPAGRTITNAGADTSLIANCIVLPVDDSMDDIFQTLKEAALLQQAGSGLGFAFDRLRPAMAKTKKSQGSSSGPVSFLKIYNESFGIIKQQGRHGANMAMMSVDHPDILDFLRAKELEGDIRNFNISVKVTDEFMKQVQENPNEQWYCKWREEWPGGARKVKPQRVLRHPNGNVYGVQEVDITVSELFDEISHYAWSNGEPGIVFIDEVNRRNPLPELGEIESSNPCGEQFLHPYDNCNLGSINLAEFVKNGEIDEKRLIEVTKTSVRMLDNVIDRFDFPVEKVTDLANKNRRIGLGIMGFADMLYQMGVSYDSEEGIAIGEKAMGIIQEAAHKMSQELAKEKGEFPNYKKSVFAVKKIKMRNAALTTVAPTGTISMMLDTSSGIEPNFALAFIKQDKDGEHYNYLNTYFEKELKNRKYTKEEIDTIKDEVIAKGTIQHLTDLPQDLRDTFVVSMDITGEGHVKMQSSFQKHVDNSISKTINLPNDATLEDIKNSYIEAWKLGCKSCTVYRDGSRAIQAITIGDSSSVISMTEDPKKQKKLMDQSSTGAPTLDKDGLKPRVRPRALWGKTYQIKTGYGNLYITVNVDENDTPFEVFAAIGKNGGFFQEQSEAICRLISLSLRSNISAYEVIDQLRGIRGPQPVITERGTILSLPDAIGWILEEHIVGDVDISEADEEEVVLSSPVKLETSVGDVGRKKAIADYGHMPGCPDCGALLQMAEGCMSCTNCGFSKCS